MGSVEDVDSIPAKEGNDEDSDSITPLRCRKTFIYGGKSKVGIDSTLEKCRETFENRDLQRRILRLRRSSSDDTSKSQDESTTPKRSISDEEALSHMSKHLHPDCIKNLRSFVKPERSLYDLLKERSKHLVESRQRKEGT